MRCDVIGPVSGYGNGKEISCFRYLYEYVIKGRFALSYRYWIWGLWLLLIVLQAGAGTGPVTAGHIAIGTAWPDATGGRYAAIISRFDADVY